MTTPARLDRRNYGSGHSYKLDGHAVPGVTSIINVLAKPALIGWAAKATARAAVDHWDRLATLEAIDRYEFLVGAKNQQNKKATTGGQRIHAMGERLAHGHDVEVPDEYRAQVEAYARLLDAWDLTAIATETAVASTTVRYAGTADGWFDCPRLGGTILADIKTGSGVYAETALQLAAYRNADLMLKETPQVGPRGGKLPPLREDAPVPEVAGAYVIHVPAPEGPQQPVTAELIPVDTSDEVFLVFRYLREVYDRWDKRTKDKNAANYAPPIGEAIYLEQYPDPDPKEDTK